MRTKNLPLPLSSNRHRLNTGEVYADFQVHKKYVEKLTGGKPLRVPLHEQILSVLVDGKKKTAELIATVDGYPTAIKNELRRLLDAGEVVKVKGAVYTLPKV